MATFVGTLFRQALTDFRMQRGLKTNPAEYLVKPRRKEKERRVQRVPDRAELGHVPSVIDEVSKASAGYLAVYARRLRLCILTGCRIQEALDAPWAEFDLE